MKAEDLLRYVEPKRKVKIFLKSGGIWTGFILVIGDNSFLFKERDGKDMMISYDALQVVEPVSVPIKNNGKSGP